MQLMSRICALLSVVFLIASCESGADIDTKQPELDMPPVGVHVYKVASADWSPQVVTFGEFDSGKQVNLTSDISAVIARLHVNSGDRVKAGQVLVTYDRTRLNLNVDKAKAELEQAKAEFEKYSGKYNKYQQLYKENIIPRDQLQDIAAAYRGAQSIVKQRQANYKLSQADVNSTSLVAPIDGIIDRKTIEKGDRIAKGQLVFIIKSPEFMRFTSFISHREIHAIKVGSIANITSPSLPGVIVSGRVEIVSNTPLGRTGNYEIKIAVPNEEGLIVPGMIGSATLESMLYHDQLQIPRSAIVDIDEHWAVFKVQSDKAIMASPVIGASESKMVPVFAGLKAGDLIITSPLDQIVDGTSIAILEK